MRMQSNLTSMESATRRLHARREDIDRQIGQLQQSLSGDQAPEQQFQEALSSKLEEKSGVEQELNQSRQGIDRLEQEIRSNQQRHGGPHRGVARTGRTRRRRP